MNGHLCLTAPACEGQSTLQQKTSPLCPVRWRACPLQIEWQNHRDSQRILTIVIEKLRGRMYEAVMDTRRVWTKVLGQMRSVGTGPVSLKHIGISGKYT